MKNWKLNSWRKYPVKHIPTYDDDKELNDVLNKLKTYCSRILEPEMQRVAPESSITTLEKFSVPPLVASDDNPAETLVRQLTGQNRCEVAAFTAEAGLFQNAGIPSVICGPGSIDQAHRPNEYIDISQLDECSNFLVNLADWAAN